MTAQDHDDDVSSKPQWDAVRAASLIGQRVLIGITYLESDGETVIEIQQMHGIISGAARSVGVTIQLRGDREGRTIVLPPDLDVFEDAAPGEYRLKQTGEVVINPDLLTTWAVRKPKN